jgi:hypothetical protein
LAPVQGTVKIISLRFGVIKGFDKTGKMVEYVTEKKGFFGKS